VFFKKQIFAKSLILSIFGVVKTFWEKVKVLSEHFTEKNAQNHNNNPFLYLEIGTTNSRWTFWENSKNQNLAFSQKN
jgi:hypothetical protein